MNVQQKLSEFRSIIQQEKESALKENRQSQINIEFEELLIIAETQNVCIKALKKMTHEELTKWLVEENNELNNLSPVQLIESGDVNKVYQIIS